MSISSCAGGERVVCLDREMLAEMADRKMAQRAQPDFSAGDAVRAGPACDLVDTTDESVDDDGFMHRRRRTAADQ